ncbi:MAG: hypothetical protein IKQ49_03270 [Eubacterium sp.]|nr:hypothetical protein [Eubacterium sp.]
MKRLKYGLLAAALVASAAAVPAVSEAAEGGWVKSAGGWWYQYEDGSYAASEFVGGYWLNGAGWLRDTTAYNWVYVNGNWQYIGKYQGKTWKASANWYKIDGQWFFFLANGNLATNQFVGPDGDYYVDEEGAWVEGVSGGWQEQADGSWKFAMTKDGETTYYAEDDAAFNNGWYEINGKEYHFNEDGILDTWKVIETPIFEDGKLTGTEVVGVTKNGNPGLVTKLTFNDEAEVTLLYSFKNNAEVKKAAEELKAMFISMYGNAKQGLFTAPVEVNGKNYIVTVKANTADAGKIVDWDDNLNPIYGKAGYDVLVRSEANPDGVDIVEFLAGTKDGKYQDGRITKLDKMEAAVTFTGDLTKTFLFTKTLFGGEYTYKIYLGKDTKAPVITDFVINDSYVNVVVDGVEYQAYYKSTYLDADGNITEDITKAKFQVADKFYFLGDQSTKLGQKLFNAGAVKAYEVEDTSNHSKKSGDEYKAPAPVVDDDGIEIKPSKEDAQ